MRYPTPDKLKDFTDKRFGTLTVRAEYTGPRASKDRHWHCVCDCGAERVVRGTNLQSGNTVGCGDRTRHPHSTDPDFGGPEPVYSFEEIAEHLKISKTLARNTCEQALRKLRQNPAALRAFLESMNRRWYARL